MSIQRQRGFSLLEVMIAVTVGAIGMLAIINLNLTNVGATRSGYYRTMAVNYARDMAERIQANKAAISVWGTSAYDLPAPAASNFCRTTAGCNNPAILAAHDYWEWQNAISGSSLVISPISGISATGLPNGSGTVCVDSDGIVGSATLDLSAALCDQAYQVNPSTHVIRVRWTEFSDIRSVDYVIRIDPNHKQGY